MTQALSTGASKGKPELSPEVREFVLAEFRKVLKGAVACRTNMADGSFTLEVNLPSERAVKKIQNLWAGLDAKSYGAFRPLEPETEKSRRPNASSQNVKEVHVAFQFVDMGGDAKGAEFLAAAGDALTVVACNMSDSMQAKSRDPVIRRSPGARAYQNAEAELNLALEKMFINHQLESRR